MLMQEFRENVDLRLILERLINRLKWWECGKKKDDR